MRVHFRTEEGTDAYNSLYFCILYLLNSEFTYTFATVKTNKTSVLKR